MGAICRFDVVYFLRFLAAVQKDVFLYQRFPEGSACVAEVVDRSSPDFSKSSFRTFSPKASVTEQGVSAVHAILLNHISDYALPLTIEWCRRSLRLKRNTVSSMNRLLSLSMAWAPMMRWKVLGFWAVTALLSRSDAPLSGMLSFHVITRNGSVRDACGHVEHERRLFICWVFTWRWTSAMIQIPKVIIDVE